LGLFEFLQKPVIGQVRALLFAEALVSKP
jgi:hypothetical protein